MYRLFFFTIAVSILLMTLFTDTSHAADEFCVYQPDAPGCSCFNNTGIWDPSGGFIQDIALETNGTRESCACPGVSDCDWDPDPSDADNDFRNAGKPYYQMVLGCNEPFDAFAVAVILAYEGEYGGQEYNFHKRCAWCSETVSFWHKHAHIPYNDGYRCDWHPSWQVYNAKSLTEWYEIDDRGRFILYDQVDYENFELGVTVPVPGAYVAIRGYEDIEPRPVPGFESKWQSWNKTGHSLIINEMWVHQDAAGNVFQVNATLLEGNSRNRVRTDRAWDDILDLTPQGPAWIGSRKIYGFGIDLDDDGEPIYDESRLHYVQHPYYVGTPLYAAFTIADPQRDEETFKAVYEYAQMVQKKGGPRIVTSSKKLLFNSLPNSQSPWSFPPELKEEIIVTIDLLDEHPYPVTGLDLVWDAQYVPPKYKVKYAGNDKIFAEAEMHSTKSLQLPKQIQKELQVVRVPISFSEKSARIRYLRFIVSAQTFPTAAILKEVNFQLNSGDFEDAEDNSFLSPTYRPSVRVDIQADGKDKPLNISLKDPFTCTIGLSPEGRKGQMADWWIAAYTPKGWKSLVVRPKGFVWEDGLRRCIELPLVKLPSLEIPRPTLAKGKNLIIFAVDNNADRRPNATWWDSIEITVE